MEPEKEEELVTTFLEFEYLHRKSRCEMLIDEDDISNDLSRIGLDRFRFTLIARNSNSSVDGEPQGIERRNSNSRDVVATLLPFPAPPPEWLVKLAHRRSRDNIA